MHTLATKFGALAMAPFIFFGGAAHFGNYWHWPTPTPIPHQPDAALSIASIDGPSSLAVNADGTWTVNADSDGQSTLHYSVKWGDEGFARDHIMAASVMIQSSATLTHAYVSAGTYHPEFTVTDDSGHTAIKSTTVFVGEQSSLHLDSVTPDSGTLGASATVSGTGFDASSTVTVGGVLATNQIMNSDGTISFTIPSLATGTYNVRVHDGDERSNAVTFTVIATTPGLSVSGVDAPVMLAVGASGTWTVHAGTDSSNLHYSVNWGDEGVQPLMMAANATVQTSATFTHSYETAGIYMPKFTVSDDSGHSETVSASVVVR